MVPVGVKLEGGSEPSKLDLRPVRMTPDSETHPIPLTCPDSDKTLVSFLSRTTIRLGLQFRPSVVVWAAEDLSGKVRRLGLGMRQNKLGDLSREVDVGNGSEGNRSHSRLGPDGTWLGKERRTDEREN